MPGVHTATRRPSARSRGTMPARASEDLPLPEAPMSARKPDSTTAGNTPRFRPRVRRTTRCRLRGRPRGRGTGTRIATRLRASRVRRAHCPGAGSPARAPRAPCSARLRARSRALDRASCSAPECLALAARSVEAGREQRPPSFAQRLGRDERRAAQPRRGGRRVRVALRRGVPPRSAAAPSSESLPQRPRPSRRARQRVRPARATPRGASSSQARSCSPDSAKLVARSTRRWNRQRVDVVGTDAASGIHPVSSRSRRARSPCAGG